MHSMLQSMEQLKSDKELGMAIKRAMAICRNLGFPLEQHFGKRYVSNSDSHILILKCLKTVYFLTMINGNPDNFLVGRFQWSLVKVGDVIAKVKVVPGFGYTKQCQNLIECG